MYYLPSINLPPYSTVSVLTLNSRTYQRSGHYDCISYFVRRCVSNTQWQWGTDGQLFSTDVSAKFKVTWHND